jgi:hypothetical protein
VISVLVGIAEAALPVFVAAVSRCVHPDDSILYCRLDSFCNETPPVFALPDPAGGHHDHVDVLVAQPLYSVRELRLSTEVSEVEASTRCRLRDDFRHGRPVCPPVAANVPTGDEGPSSRNPVREFGVGGFESEVENPDSHPPTAVAPSVDFVSLDDFHPFAYSRLGRLARPSNVLHPREVGERS